MAGKHMKRLWMSLTIREIQTKTKVTMRYHYLPIWNDSKNILIVTTPNNDEDVEKWDCSNITGENVKWYSTLENRQFYIKLDM